MRKYLFSRGFRYRLNHPRLPGRPDLVLRKYRSVIFVNGCFWHGHENCKYYVLPKSNAEFWRSKIERNHARDIEEQRKLAQMGWHCVMENIFKYQEHLVRAYAGCFVAQLAYMLHYVFSVSSSCLRLSLLTE